MTVTTPVYSLPLFNGDAEATKQSHDAEVNRVVRALVGNDNFVLSQISELISPGLLVGDWDAGTGSFPTTRPDGSPIQRGDSWRVSGAGTVDGQAFDVGDYLQALRNGGGATFAGNWSLTPWGQIQKWAAQAEAFGRVYTENDAELNNVYIPDGVMLMVALPASSSPGQVAPVGEESRWVLTAPPTALPYRTSNGGAKIWTQVSLTMNEVLSVLNSAIAAAFRDPAYAGVQPFASWGEMITATIPMTVKRIGCRVSNGSTIWFLRDILSIAIPDFMGWVPDGAVWGEHFGAVSYTTQAAAEAGVDSAPAMKSAAKFIRDSNVNRLIHIAGDAYRIGSTVTIDWIGGGFIGTASGGCILVVDDFEGEGVRYTRDAPTLLGVTVTASAARRAGAYNPLKCGIRIEPEDAPDTTALRVRFVNFRNYGSLFHSGHGVAMAGGTSGIMENPDVRGNKGQAHAVAYDLFPRTYDTEVPGLLEITGGVVTGNGGHAFATPQGIESSSPAVRIGITNVEIGGNATDPDVRLWPSEIWLRGSQIDVTRCVFKPAPGSGIEGWFVAGTNINIENNRYINCPRAGVVSSFPSIQTRNVSVDGVQFIDAPGPVDPAVLVRKETGAQDPRGIEVRNVNGGIINRLVGTDATMGNAGASRIPGVTSLPPVLLYPSADFVINNSAAFADVPGLQVWLAPNERVYIDATISYMGDPAADAMFRVQGPAGSATSQIVVNSAKVGTDDAVIAQSADASGYAVGATMTPRLLVIRACVTGGSIAGYARVQAKQLIATAADLTILANLSNIVVARGLQA